jgi:hypothetical protein
LVTIEDIVDTEKSDVAADVFTDALRDTLQQRPSSKQLAGVDLGRLEATPSLNHRAAA